MRGPSSFKAGGRLLFDGGVLTSSWMVATAGGQGISDLLLFGGGLMLCLADPRRSSRVIVRLRWMALPVLTVFVSSIANQATFQGNYAGIATALQFCLALLAVPVLVGMRVDSFEAAQRLSILLATSFLFNSFFALGDFIFGLEISPAQQSWSDSPWVAAQRAVGLTGHPNVLGYVCSVGIPLTVARITAGPRPKRVLWALAGALLCLGLVLSGSRGGLLGAALGYLFVLTKVPTNQRLTLGTLPTITVPAVLLLFPGSSLVARTTGDAGSSASDSARAENLLEALHSAYLSLPLGAGFDQLLQVHAAPLALITSGGLVASGAAALWFRRWIVTTRSIVGRTPGERSILLSLRASSVGALGFLATQPLIYHRYALIPSATLLALSLTTSLETRATPKKRETTKVA